MKKNIILFVLIFSSCYNKKSTEIVIEELKQYSSVDTVWETGKSKLYLSKCFIIKNTKNKMIADSVILKYVKTQKDFTFEKFDEWTLAFYRESDITNQLNLAKNYKELVRYSEDHDLLYSVSGTKGRKMNIIKFKNGEMIFSSPSDIKVTDP